MAEIQNLKAVIDADVRGFRNGMRQVTDATKRMRGGVRDASRGMNRNLASSENAFRQLGTRAQETSGKIRGSFLAIAAAAAAATAALAGITQSFRSVINDADAIAKSSQKFGISVEELSRLAHGANMSGVSVEALGTSFRRLSQSMIDTAAGTGEAEDAFRRLQINVQNADGSLKSSQEVMMEVADRFSRMEDGADKTAIAMDIFGKAGADMIPFLNAGRDGIQEMNDEADRLGITLSTNTAKQAEQFNDNMTRLSEKLRGAYVVLAEHLLPKLIDLSNRLLDVTFDSRTAAAASSLLSGMMSAAAAVAVTLAGNIHRVSVELETYSKIYNQLAEGDFSGAGTTLVEGTKKSLGVLKDTAEQVKEVLGLGETKPGDLENLPKQEPYRPLPAPYVPLPPAASGGGGKSAAEKAANEAERAAERVRKSIEDMAVETASLTGVFGELSPELAQSLHQLGLLSVEMENGAVKSFRLAEGAEKYREVSERLASSKAMADIADDTEKFAIEAAALAGVFGEDVTPEMAVLLETLGLLNVETENGILLNHQLADSHRDIVEAMKERDAAEERRKAEEDRIQKEKDAREEQAQRIKDESTDLAHDITDPLENALKGNVAKWETWSDAVQNILSNLRDNLINKVFDILNKQLEKLFETMISGQNSTGGGSGLLGSLMKFLGSIFGSVAGSGGFAPGGGSSGGFGTSADLYAKGGAFSGGREITAFARGGVVDNPTIFPMAKGIGLMGEAGAEAILPLSRGAGGKLGVHASGVGGGGGNTVVNVYAPPGSEVKEERTKSGSMEQINLYIQQAVSRALQDPGSQVSRTMSTQFGARPVTITR